jgi:hypothetical protein
MRPAAASLRPLRHSVQPAGSTGCPKSIPPPHLSTGRRQRHAYHRLWVLLLFIVQAAGHSSVVQLHYGARQIFVGARRQVDAAPRKPEQASAAGPAVP